MSRDLRIRGNDYAGRSHNAPGARRELNVIQLAGRNPLRLDARSHGPECKKTTMLSFRRASMQTGNNLSPGLFASVFAGSHGGEMNQHLFSSRASFKLAQFAQAMLDVSVGLLIASFILLLFASPFIAAFCLLFLSVH